MALSDFLSEITPCHISDIEPGMFLVNLGEVLEIEKSLDEYSLVISRMNQKQVVKFRMDVVLIICPIWVEV